MRVMIAEDEAIIRMDLKEILKENACDVVGMARSGEEAIDLARRLRPDCAFVDIQMQGCDGLEAARVICAENLCAVVILSAFSQESFVHQAAEAGVMAYVSKPFSEADIIPALHVAVSRFAQQQALASEVDDLQERLETRKVVERAKGLLMKEGLDEPEAFRRLQRTAMTSRKTLREVAEAYLLAYELRS